MTTQWIAKEKQFGDWQIIKRTDTPAVLSEIPFAIAYSEQAAYTLINILNNYERMQVEPSEPTTTYPTYSGIWGECAKCGSKSATTTYYTKGICGHETGHTTYNYNGPRNKRLHRECGRCGYQWDEAPLDAQTKG